MDTIISYLNGIEFNEETLILLSVLFFTVMIVVTIFVFIAGSRSK